MTGDLNHSPTTLPALVAHVISGPRQANIAHRYMLVIFINIIENAIARHLSQYGGLYTALPHLTLFLISGVTDSAFLTNRPLINAVYRVEQM